MRRDDLSEGHRSAEADHQTALRRQLRIHFFFGESGRVYLFFPTFEAMIG